MTQAKEENTYGGFGRIEVVPEVLLSIAEQVIHETSGVIGMAPVPSGRRGRKALMHEGITLEMSENQTVFDLFLVMDPTQSIMENSRKLQSSLVDAVDKMIGIPVHAVNIHVEDVAYPASETV